MALDEGGTRTMIERPLCNILFLVGTGRVDSIVVPPEDSDKFLLQDWIKYSYPGPCQPVTLATVPAA